MTSMDAVPNSQPRMSLVRMMGASSLFSILAFINYKIINIQSKISQCLNSSRQFSKILKTSALPSSITISRLQSSTVRMMWAMLRVVHLYQLLIKEMNFQLPSWSIEEVASSRISIFGRFRRLRHTVINCFSPADRFYADEFRDSLSNFFPKTDSRTWQICSQRYFPSGSMFFLRVDLKRNGFWGITPNIFLSLPKGISTWDTLSIRISPLSRSQNLNKAFRSDVFPAPVLPIIPIFSPFSIKKLTLFRATLPLGYFITTSLNSMESDYYWVVVNSSSLLQNSSLSFQTFSNSKTFWMFISCPSNKAICLIPNWIQSLRAITYNRSWAVLSFSLILQISTIPMIDATIVHAWIMKAVALCTFPQRRLARQQSITLCLNFQLQ